MKSAVGAQEQHKSQVDRFQMLPTLLDGGTEPIQTRCEQLLRLYPLHQQILHDALAEDDREEPGHVS